jgi:aspartate aminotransferase
MKKVQSQSTSNPCSISQAASIAALNGDQSCVTHMLKAFRERHDYLVAELNNIPGFNCIEGAGTFYAFPDISEAMAAKGCEKDSDFSELLMKHADVALVPGSAFGAPGYLRLSFATSMEVLHKAVGRIQGMMS